MLPILSRKWNSGGGGGRGGVSGAKRNKEEKRSYAEGKVTSFPPKKTQKKRREEKRRIACGEFPLSNSSRSPLLLVGVKDENECGQIKAFFSLASLPRLSLSSLPPTPPTPKRSKGTEETLKSHAGSFLAGRKGEGRKPFAHFYPPFLFRLFCPR